MKRKQDGNRDILKGGGHQFSLKVMEIGLDGESPITIFQTCWSYLTPSNDEKKPTHTNRHKELALL